MRNDKDIIQSMREILDSVKREDISKKGIPSYIGFFKDPLTGKKVDFDDIDVAPSGFTRNDVHIIMGPPGNGKTEWALQCAVLQAINGYKVLYVSLEQTPFKIMAKMIAKVDGKRAYEWEQMPYATEEEFNKKKQKALDIIEAYFEKNARASMMNIVYGTYSTVELTEFLNTQFKKDYDIIYVDNFQNAYGSETKDYELMSRKTRGNILGTDTAMVWLSQIDEKTGRTKNSRSVEEDAALAIRVYREKKKDKYDKKQSNEGDLPEVEKVPTSYIDIVKNRHDGYLAEGISFPYDAVKGRFGSFVIDDLETRLVKRGNELRAYELKDEREKTEYEREKIKEKEVLDDFNELFLKLTGQADS